MKNYACCVQVVEAVKMILYAADGDDASIMAEAQAMVSLNKKNEAEQLSPIAESSEEKLSAETQKRKSILNLEFETAGVSALSPRRRLSDASDVHFSGSPLVTF